MSFTFKEGCDVDHPLDLLKRIESEFTENKTVFRSIDTEAKIVYQYEQMLDSWSTPKFFEKNSAKLIESFTNWFIPKDHSFLKIQYDTANTLGRFAVLEFLSRSVDVFDKTIKSVEGSSAFNNMEKIKAFATLLETYRQMMLSAVTLLPAKPYFGLVYDEINETSSHPIHLPTDLRGIYLMTTTFDDYLKDLFKGFDKHQKVALQGKLTEEEIQQELTSRPIFYVQPFLIGSTADLFGGYDWPDRLEEYFTLFHQTIESVKNILFCDNGFENNLLPKHIGKMTADLEKAFNTAPSNVAFKTEKAEICFNIPLGQHAARVALIYNPKKIEEGFDLRFTAFGGNESDRWDHMITALSIVAKQPGLSLVGVPKIDYKNAFNMEVVIHVDDSFQDLSPLANNINVLLKTLAKGLGRTSADTPLIIYDLIKECVPSLFLDGALKNYELSISLNNALMRNQLQTIRTTMDPATKEKAVKTIVKIAVETIKGLTTLGIPPDYANKHLNNAFICTETTPSSNAYLDKLDVNIQAERIIVEQLGWTEHLPEIYYTNSPLDASQACLSYLIDKKLIGKDDLKELLEDPVVASHFPLVLERLTKIL